MGHINGLHRVIRITKLLMTTNQKIKTATTQIYSTYMNMKKNC